MFFMITTIYLMRKPGEPRVYTNTIGFIPELKDKLIAEGYSLFKIEVDLDQDYVRQVRPMKIEREG